MYTEEEGGGIQADVQELAPIWTFLEGTLKGEGERERERVILRSNENAFMPHTKHE